ncbi:MAG: hypothetical protein IPM50_00075 [Acidobacteriota bacterium]|nr:MAG: hypothetical protein IPM50_00075 [Acidobacteriota bacterium]
MIATGYKRVSKKRPCGICGKPDWCSTTATETISFCARSTLNADRVSRHGWGVFYHQDSGFDFNFNRTFSGTSKRKKTRASKLLAPPPILDTVYRKLIELSPASSNYEIVNGRGGLLERGIDDLSLYGSLPRLVNERRVLVERLVEALAKGGIRSFQGIPGFWKNSSGSLRLWGEQDSFDDLMLIPFVGSEGLIRACQIRFMRYVRNKSGRYVWLSSSKERTGCGPGAPLHHANPGSRLNKPVLVTEGALKAATAQTLLTDRYVVGNSGVATAHREIVETARGRALEIAFDNDSLTNPHVARALAALVRLRRSDQNSYAYNDDVRIVAWDKRIKGLDDALLTGTPLKYLTVAEWLKYLTPECLEQASGQLSFA